MIDYSLAITGVLPTRRCRLEQKRVNDDIPVWINEQLEREASFLVVMRQSIITVSRAVWLAARLEQRPYGPRMKDVDALCTP